MPKEKMKINIDKRNYLCIAIGILVIVLSLLMIGRVGGFFKLYLVIKILFGDYSILLLLFFIFYSIRDLIFNKKIYFNHVYFIGFILIYIGLSIFAHLGLYDALAMSNSNVLTKSFSLYTRYFSYYDVTFSCGGGIVIASILQGIMLLGGKISGILLAIALIIIGISYILDFNILKIFKGGKFKNIPIKTFKGIFKYFKSIKYPIKPQKNPKISLSILMDNEEPVNFTIQNEINKERLLTLKEYIKNNHIYCVCDNVLTSYTSSRFIVKLAHKSESIISELTAFFNKQCFIIKNDLIINIEVPNQFKKLLTLKQLLLAHNNKNALVIGIDVDNDGIELPINEGRTLCVVGDYTSGIKTFVRAMLAAIILKGYDLDSIFFYDLYYEFSILSKSKTNYINNERSAAIAFDEAFKEYERRIELLKYLNVDNIDDANKRITQMGNEYEKIKPIFHFVFLNPNCFNTAMYQKLSYLLQFGIKVGMIVFLLIRDKNVFNKMNLNNCDILAFYLNDVSTSVKLFGCDIACRLQKKGDILYQTKSKIYHGQTPYISLDDFEKIINQL